MSFYDNDNMDQKTMAERCREYYDPAEFVVIMNCDIEPFTYIIQRPENVTIHQPSNVTKELYYSKEPDVVTLQPGQTRMVPAYEADHVIKQLTDKIVFRGRQDVDKETGKTSTGSAMDPSTQHRYIKLIYQGKKDFMDEYNRQISQPNILDDELTKELDDDITDTTAPRGPGRPKRQVA